MNRRYSRVAAKVDANQKELVSRINNEIYGATAVSIGKPLDILVGFQGRNYLIEIKNPDGKDMRGPSWETQKAFMASWEGQSAVCRTFDDVIATLLGLKHDQDEHENGNNEAPDKRNED